LHFRFLFAYNVLGTKHVRACQERHYGLRQDILMRLTMQVQEQLGTRIRQFRRKKGWSQEEFADRCGLHRSHMGEIERGHANITLLTLVAIAQTLGTSAATLLKDIA
jgi:DNA-binding XRE family transcriptional regulator